ncbi:hypothetical protein E1A91_A12G207500v1 [Gossypium mustelinum]|uniref:Uncharacterized protein n=4 Tax=Gossypium TaxID=3633 RepID=A0A5J5TD38_GOSBA|nr:hypothetical protein ES319_A12G201400v1 [Gossypium barbadense]TYG90900.1 hypothetical protein ES288_A12G219900v1 [Gossypium darwinii]TYJ06065.1 hypothetical protein E1A91_A12G207500v1 [Gossypium mustelinum]
MTIELLSSHHHFMRHRICFSWVSFLMTVNSSPSTHISRKPISSAMVTACTHALASAVVGSVIFSHGKRKLQLPSYKGIYRSETQDHMKDLQKIKDWQWVQSYHVI